jgi:hypothetical protein
MLLGHEDGWVMMLRPDGLVAASSRRSGTPCVEQGEPAETVWSSLEALHLTPPGILITATLSGVRLQSVTEEPTYQRRRHGPSCSVLTTSSLTESIIPVIWNRHNLTPESDIQTEEPGFLRSRAPSVNQYVATQLSALCCWLRLWACFLLTRYATSSPRGLDGLAEPFPPGKWGDQPVFMEIRLRARASAVLGTVMVRTPFLKVASALSSSTSLGKDTDR